MGVIWADEVHPVKQIHLDDVVVIACFEPENTEQRRNAYFLC